MKITFRFNFKAAFMALIIFSLFPEVEIAISTSPLLIPTASTCLEKTYSKPKSFPIAVIRAIFEDSESAFIGSLSQTFQQTQLKYDYYLMRYHRCRKLKFYIFFN